MTGSLCTRPEQYLYAIDMDVTGSAARCCSAEQSCAFRWFALRVSVGNRRAAPRSCQGANAFVGLEQLAWPPTSFAPPPRPAGPAAGLAALTPARRSMG